MDAREKDDGEWWVAVKFEGSRAGGLRLFTSTEYYRMGEVGIIGPDERVELVGGLIYEMPPITPGHARAVGVLHELLMFALSGRAEVRGQSPVHLDDRSDPQPDVAAVKLIPDDYLERHPEAADIFLLVEVADSGLHRDRTVKIPRYALTGVPEVWLIDLDRRVATVYRDPSDGCYLSETPVAIGGALSPMAFPYVGIPLARIVR